MQMWPKPMYPHVLKNLKSFLCHLGIRINNHKPATNMRTHIWVVMSLTKALKTDGVDKKSL